MTSMWDNYVRGRHARLVSVWAERMDMQTKGFHAECRRRLSLEPWRSDGWFDGDEEDRDANAVVLELLHERRYLPDAFRFRVEGSKHGWGHPVLAIEVLEVTVTHPTPEQKLDWYDRLWWACDASDRLEFRAFETYDETTLEEMMGEDMAHRRLSRELRRAA